MARIYNEDGRSWTRINIRTFEDGSALALYSTNDNLDRRYPTEYAYWEARYPSLEAALKVTGKSRQGMLCDVTVTVNGGVV